MVVANSRCKYFSTQGKNASTNSLALLHPNLACQVPCSSALALLNEQSSKCSKNGNFQGGSSSVLQHRQIQVKVYRYFSF